MARPSALKLAAPRILESLRRDGDWAKACAYAGVPLSTGYRWRDGGREPGASPELVAFSKAVEDAISVGSRAQYELFLAELQSPVPVPARTDAAAIATSIASDDRPQT